ncbi:MAG TPA: hypothetical protein PKX46_00495, partial [Clostridia bacterium]|nr:hypothetical protein [Clostridia bacterium]
GIVVSATGRINDGVVPILAVFILGGLLLLFVPDDKSRQNK